MAKKLQKIVDCIPGVQKMSVYMLNYLLVNGHFLRHPVYLKNKVYVNCECFIWMVKLSIPKYLFYLSFESSFPFGTLAYNFSKSQIFKSVFLKIYFPGMMHYKGQCLRYYEAHVATKSPQHPGTPCLQSQTCHAQDINYVCVGAGDRGKSSEQESNVDVGMCRCRDDMRVNQWFVLIHESFKLFLDEITSVRLCTEPCIDEQRTFI